MQINATLCRIDEEAAKRLAAKERRGLLDVVFDAINKKDKDFQVLRTAQFYYPFYCAGVTMRFKRAANLPTRDVVALAVMECAFGSVSTMQGVPQLELAEVDPRRVVKNRYTQEEAKTLICDFLKKKGSRRFRSLPQIEIFEFGLIYKPHYACLCRRGKKEFYRVIDAETGERNYMLDIVFRDLKFGEDRAAAQ
jgi:hypothetical protein